MRRRSSRTGPPAARPPSVPSGAAPAATFRAQSQIFARSHCVAHDVAPIVLVRRTILKEETMADGPAILLVHGAWHSSRCWDKVRAVLELRGRQVHAVNLPTVHAGNKASLDMYDDARAVRAAIEEIGGPVVVVAHSYGGVPATQGAAGLPTVVHIVYIAAFVLDQGESLLAAAGGVPPSWWNVKGDLATAGVPGEPPEQ